MYLLIFYVCVNLKKKMYKMIFILIKKKKIRFYGIFFSTLKNYEYKYSKNKLKVPNRFLIVFGNEKYIYESVVSTIRAKRALVEHTQNNVTIILKRISDMNNSGYDTLLPFE